MNRFINYMDVCTMSDPNEELRALVRETVSVEFARRDAEKKRQDDEDFRRKIESEYRHQKAKCEMQGIPPPISPPWMRDQQDQVGQEVRSEPVKRKTNIVFWVILVIVNIIVTVVMTMKSKHVQEPAILNSTVEESRVLIGHDSIPAKSTGNFNTIIGGSHNSRVDGKESDAWVY